jgi:hypothetical protein
MSIVETPYTVSLNFIRDSIGKSSYFRHTSYSLIPCSSVVTGFPFDFAQGGELVEPRLSPE